MERRETFAPPADAAQSSNLRSAKFVIQLEAAAI